MIVLYYILLIIASLILAVASVWFRQSYIGEKKISFSDVITKHNVLTMIISVVYVLFAVLSLVFYEAKGISFLEMTESLLLWDCMFLIAAIDFKVKKIPNKLLLILLAVRVVALVILALTRPEDIVVVLISSLIGMAVGGFMILAVLVVSKGQVGAGDLKLFAVIGFFFGLTGLLQIMIYSLLLSCIVAIGLLVSRKAKMKSTMPMAPFIFVGLTLYYVLL